EVLRPEVLPPEARLLGAPGAESRYRRDRSGAGGGRPQAGPASDEEIRGTPPPDARDGNRLGWNSSGKRRSRPPLLRLWMPARSYRRRSASPSSGWVGDGVVLEAHPQPQPVRSRP